jgi:hypothetical protein
VGSLVIAPAKTDLERFFDGNLIEASWRSAGTSSPNRKS